MPGIQQPAPVNRKERNQGMNWIRKEKRLAIYLRDGMACCYCGQAVEDGIKLTLDHLTPHCKGGSNQPTNLVTCCHTCNSVRGNRCWMAFSHDVASYINRNAADIIIHIDTCIETPLNIAEAKALMARRGGFVQACQS